MQAIVTKFLGPTNHRGARVTARSETLRLTVPWDDALDVEKNHAAAAAAFAHAHGWHGSWVGGGLPDTTGNAYVRASHEDIAANGSIAVAFVASEGGTAVYCR